MHDRLADIARLEADLAREATAAGFHALGGLKLAAADADGAARAYTQCMALSAPNAGLLNNLGAALSKAGRYPEAIVALESALRLEPGYPRALVNLGKALREVGRLPEAVARLREVLAVDPLYVPALVNLGDALASIGELAGAEHALELALRRDPGHIEARTARGITRLQAGKLAEALDDLRAAVALAPQHADAHANLAHALFASGDWAAAWPHFEHRFRRHAQRAPLRTPRNMLRWEGTIAEDLELWLIGEQGLGDQLHFARYAKVLHETGVRCVIACDPRLVALLSRVGLGARIVAFDTVPETFDTVPETSAARWFPLMSLPGWHGTRPETVPCAGGYLAADLGRVARWRPRIPADGLRVALAWAGNPRMETGRYIGRSPPLAAFAPLMAVPGTRFVSVQKGAGEEQLESAPFGRRIQRLADLDEGTDAFLDTAAILSCVDLLVTSDTAIAHLAGALGVPTWLCLMHEPDWRWMRHGDSTPWYASLRLFRQPFPGDWASVFSEVARELGVKAAADRALT